MHNVVVDSIRRRNAQVHGGHAVQVELETGIAAVNQSGNQRIEDVARAIEELERYDSTAGAGCRNAVFQRHD